MCGIAGIFAYHSAATPVERDELRAIRDHMAARGAVNRRRAWGISRRSYTGRKTSCAFKG